MGRDKQARGSRPPADVRESFAKAAPLYVESCWHAGQAQLAAAIEFCQGSAGDRVLDVGTGTGNLGLALAATVGRVTGLDLTAGMLQEARRQGESRGISNADWVLGDAAGLPFETGSFDLYVTRAAAHHFSDFPGSLAECVRVLKGGGRGVFIDCSAPLEARDALHPIEVGRDPAHVLSYTLDAWTKELGRSGLVVEKAELRGERREYGPWMQRMSVDAARSAALARALQEVTGKAREQLRPEFHDGGLSFMYWHAFVRARKP